MHTRAEVRGWHWVSFLYYSSTYFFFEAVPLTKPGVHCFARLAGQKGPRIHLSLTPPLPHTHSPPSTGFTDVNLHTWTFMWVMWICTQALVSAQQVLLTSQLSLQIQHSLSVATELSLPPALSWVSQRLQLAPQWWPQAGPRCVPLPSRSGAMPIFPFRIFVICVFFFLFVSFDSTLVFLIIFQNLDYDSHSFSHPLSVSVPLIFTFFPSFAQTKSVLFLWKCGGVLVCAWMSVCIGSI